MDSTWKLKLGLLICFLSKLHSIHAELEPGRYEFNITGSTGDDTLYRITKSLSKHTNVILTAKCSEKVSSSCLVHLEWVLRFSDCDNAYIDTINNTDLFTQPENSMLPFENIVSYKKSIPGNETEMCDLKMKFQDHTYLVYPKCYTTLKKIPDCTTINLPAAEPKPEDKDQSTDESNDKLKGNGEKDTPNLRRKREDANVPTPETAVKPTKTTTPKANVTPVKPAKTTTPKANVTPVKPAKTTTPKKTDDDGKAGNEVAATNPHPNRITRTWIKGRFLFAFRVDLKDCDDPNIEVTVEFKNEHGYLSAKDRPLLTFYAVMCVAYTLLAFLWLLMMACQWRDILRIQFWICGVVILGLLEKVVFYSEYHHMNMSGYASPATLVFAELVSCLKRTVARMLVIIVSMGFGITKPRLGPQLHRVIGVGFLFFVLSSIEACLRVQGSVQQQLVASIPLAVLDAVICYWIFTNLVDTTRTLRLRRNVVKLWLYRHFTNSLIFCIIAAVIFLAWSMKEHKLAVCVTRWTELWLDDAYWHILFYIVLVVIIILWRPTANNQRYAYSPLTDSVDDDESKEPMIPEAFEGMKMRNVNRSDAPTKVEDDLKWVEDNIPASVADAALAVFDDSDEEIVTNIERSKME